MTFTVDGVTTNLSPERLTSATLSSALTDETGTGLAVFNTSPTLVNPTVTTQAISDNSTLAASTAHVKNTLAASSGSGLIGHIASGTGAVATTVQSKLRESVSVKDFGAVGNGTDETSYFNDAATAANQVYVPYTSNYYNVSALSNAVKNKLWGPGLVKISGTQVQINSAPSNVNQQSTNSNDFIESIVGVTYADVTGVYTGQIDGGNFECSATGASGTANTITGVGGIAFHRGQGTVLSGYGGRFACHNYSTGTLTDAIGVKINQSTNSGGGTVTNNYGAFINNSNIGSTVNSALHIYNSGQQGKISWGWDGNGVNAYIYNSANGVINVNNRLTIDASGNLISDGAIAQKIAVGTASISSAGTPFLFSIQNSKSVTFTTQGFGIHFIVSFGGTGQSGLFWATYDSAVITSVGTIPASMSLGAVGATQLGITKTANSRTITLTSGSGLLAAQTNMSITVMGSAINTLTDWV